MPKAVALFRFSEVEAKRANPQTFNSIIKDVLRAKEDLCYCEMERYLLPPGISGSKYFDQAYAVDVLLSHDKQQGARLHTAMQESGMSRRLLWDRLQNVLRSVGFKFSHGRLVGLLEDKSGTEADKDENGQPDID